MPNVLVFESDPDFAKELKEGLIGQGCTPTVVGDATEGLQVAASRPPDLILLTVELPRVNGFSVCNKLKRDPSLSDVPLIILSSDSTEDTFNQHRRLKNSRAQDYVHKPVDFQQLLPRIANLVMLPGPDHGSSGESALSNGSAEERAEETSEEDVIHISEDSYLDLDEELEEIEEIEELDASDVDEAVVAVDAEVDEFTEAAFDNLLDDEVFPPPPSQSDDLNDILSDIPISNLLQSEAPAMAQADASDDLEDQAFEDITSVEPVAIPTELSPVDPNAPEADQLLSDRPSSMSPSMSPSMPPPLDSMVPSSTGAPTMSPPTMAPASVGPLESARLSESEALAALDPAVMVAREAEIAELQEQAAERQATLDEFRQNVAQLQAEASSAAEKFTALGAQNTEHLQELDTARLALSQAAERQAQTDTALEAAQTTSSRGGTAQDFLALREQLNSKDKEILELHNQVGQKTKELLSSRERALVVERESASLDDELRGIQAQQLELTRVHDAVVADKEQASKRADDFKRRTEKLSVEAEARTQELDDARQELTDANQAHGLAVQEATALAASALSDAVQTAQAAEAQVLLAAQEEWRSAAERTQSAALEQQETRLKLDYEQAFAQLSNEHAVALGNLQEESEAALGSEKEKLRAAEERSESISEKLEQLQTEHGETEALRVAVAGQLEQEKESLATTTRSLEDVREHLLASQQELSTSQQAVTSASENAERMEQELGAMRAQNERVDVQLTEATAEADRFSQQWKSSQADVERLQGEVQSGSQKLDAEVQAKSTLQTELQESVATGAAQHEKWQSERAQARSGREALQTALEQLAFLDSEPSE